MNENWGGASFSEEKIVFAHAPLTVIEKFELSKNNDIFRWLQSIGQVI